MSADRRVLRLVTLALLYVSQAIPLGFFIVAVPAILRSEGLPLEKLGLLSALAFPWLIKFLWAPLVDRFGARWGHYRSWILPLQVGCVGVVGWMASLDLARGLAPLVVACALFMLLSATQDIATDGLAVRLLPVAERGLGNGIQVGGYYLGQVLGGGVVLILFARFGWSAAVGAMAVLLALPLPFVLALREPEELPPGPGREAVGFGALRHFFLRPMILGWVAVLLLWRSGETMAQWMFNPLLVDLGHSLDDVGRILGVAGSLASLAGALLGGFLTGRWGRRRALLAFGTLQIAALASYALPASGVGGLPLIFAVALAGAACGGMATAALYTRMMDRSRDETAATDFTLQQSLAAIGPVMVAATSGFSAAALGYAGHFLLAAGLQLATVVLAARVMRKVY